MTPTASNPTRAEFPTAAALEYRLPAYPVSRGVTEPFESAHGEIVRVTGERGAIGGRHRDMLDAILATAIKTVADQVGRVHVVFDIVDVRDMLGLARKSFDWSKLREYLIDLQATSIAIRRPGDDWPTSYPVLAIVGDAKTSAERGPNEFPAQLKKIVFSEGFVEWLKNETRLYVNKAVVRQVLALESQVSRNVARWLISHSRSQHPAIDDVLKHVGAGGGERQRRKYLVQLKNDGERLKKLGIEFDGEQLHYVRNSGVFIEACGSQQIRRLEPKSAASGTKKRRNAHFRNLKAPQKCSSKEVHKELTPPRLEAVPG